MNKYQLDVLMLVETKGDAEWNRSFDVQVQQASENRFVVWANSRSARVRSGPRTAHQGGVCMILRRDLVKQLWDTPRSLSAVAANNISEEDVIRVKVLLGASATGAQKQQQQQQRWLHLATVYLGPSLSPHEAEARLNGLQSDIATINGADVLIGGDLNGRMGGPRDQLCVDGYRSVDTRAERDPGGGHGAQLLNFCTRAGLTPAHGGTAVCPQAQWTNLNAASATEYATGLSVVDYMLVRTATAGTLMRSAQQTAAGGYADTVLSTSHALLTVELDASPAAATSVKRGLSNKIVANVDMPPRVNCGGVWEAYDKEVEQEMGVSVQWATDIQTRGQQWIRDNKERSDSEAVHRTLASMMNAAVTVDVASVISTHFRINSKLHPVVREALSVPPRPTRSRAAAELYDILFNTPRPERAPVPEAVQPAAPVAVAAANVDAHAPDVALAADGLAQPQQERGGLAQPQQGPEQLQGEGTAPPSPPTVEPAPATTARALITALSAAAAARQRAAKAVRAARAGGMQDGLALRSLVSAEKSAKRAHRVAARQCKRMAKKQHTTSVLGDGIGGKAMWERLKSAVAGRSINGTYVSDTRESAIPEFFVNDGVKVPAINAFAAAAGALYSVGSAAAADTTLPAHQRAVLHLTKAPAPISVAPWQSWEVGLVMSGLSDEDVEDEEALMNAVAAAAPSSRSPASAPRDRAAASRRRGAAPLNEAQLPPALPEQSPTMLKEGKSPGIGGLARMFIACDGDDSTCDDVRKERQQRMHVHLASFFSLFMNPDMKALPPAWQAASMNPRTKQGEPPVNADACRNVSVQPLWGKLWALLRLGRATEWAEKYEMLSESQFGFRQHRGTEDAIFTLVGTLNLFKHHKQENTFAAFVDLRKAYDMVRHDLLLAKLEAMNVGTEFIRLQRMSLANMTARVWLNGELSEPFSIDRGVPQGDPLSPLLFSLFIEDLLRELANSTAFLGLNVGSTNTSARLQSLIKVLAYADDLVLVAASPQQLQQGLNIVGQWAQRWGMEVNTKAGKTEVMCIPKAEATARPSPRPKRKPTEAAAAVSPAPPTLTSPSVTSPARTDNGSGSGSGTCEFAVGALFGEEEAHGDEGAAALAAAAIVAQAAAAAALEGEEGQPFDPQQQPADPFGGVTLTVNGRAVGVVQKYDYLGFIITSELDAAVALRSRLRAANLHALQMRALPSGLGGMPIKELAMMVMGTVLPHLEFAAGVWAPPREQGNSFNNYRVPVAARISSDSARAYTDAVKLQEDCARHVLGLASPLRWGSEFTSIALMFSELGWTHLPSRWDMARLRLLGNVIRSPAHSPMRAIAQALGRADSNCVDPAAKLRMVKWNWMTNTRSLVSAIDERESTAVKLSDDFNRDKLLPMEGNKTLLPHRRNIAAFDGRWRRHCYSAINDADGRDSAEWRTLVTASIARYVKGNGTAARAQHDTMVGTALAPAAGSARCMEPGAVRAAGATDDAVWAVFGPATCGTLSTAAHIAQLTSTAEMQTAFGRQCREPYLSTGRPDWAMQARQDLRMSVRSAVDRETGRNDAGTVPPAAGVGAAPGIPRLPGGYLWGARSCGACMKEHGEEFEDDAWHRITECTRRDDEREASFNTAIRRCENLSKRRPEKAAALKHVADTIREIMPLAGTLAGRTFVFLATLGARIPTATAPHVGIPPQWANLLRVPQGSTSMQKETVAMQITFPAFAQMARSANSRQTTRPAKRATEADQVQSAAAGSAQTEEEGEALPGRGGSQSPSELQLQTGIAEESLWDGVAFFSDDGVPLGLINCNNNNSMRDGNE